MDHSIARAFSQLQHGPRYQMSVTEPPVKRRIRNGAVGLTALALVFYFGFIAFYFYRSRH